MRYDTTQNLTEMEVCAGYTDAGVGFEFATNDGAFNQGFSCSDLGGMYACDISLPYDCGELKIAVEENIALPPHNIFSQPVDVFLFDSPACLPQCDSCSLGSSGQGAGKPVNVATGKLWYQTTDFSLSGPLGLRFSRWYDNQSTYSVDLGFGWRHNFSAYLDLTNQSSGLIAAHDEEDRISYFATGWGGTNPSAYDNVTGSTLALNSGTSVYTLTTWDNRKFLFDSAGRLTQVDDRIGNTQVVARDASNRISTVTDILGRSISFSYDASNRITSVTSSVTGGTLVSFSYSGCGSGNLCSATESDGKTWSYQYTNATFTHALTNVADPLGNAEETSTYDGSNRCATQQTQGGVNSLTFTYPSSGTTRTTDGLSRQTTYTYDPLLLLVTTVAGPGCGCGGGNQRSFSWDNFLRKKSETDGDGSTHTITWAYARDVIDPSDGSIVTAYPSPSSKTEPLQSGQSRTTSWVYYAVPGTRQDLVNTETVPSADAGCSANPKVTTFNYATNGLLNSRVEHGCLGDGTSTNYTTIYTYDANGRGRVLTIDGPRTDVSDVTTYAYFPDTDTDFARRGQLNTITDAMGNVTTYASASQLSPYNTYDIFGNARSTTDPNGVVTQRDYDGRGRLLHSKLKGVPNDPLDLLTVYAYDDAGKLTSVTLPAGNSTTYGYDGSNRLTDTIRVSAEPKQYERMHYTFDAMSQKIEEDAQNCSTPANPCAAGNWVTQRKENFQYDGYGRLSEIDHPVPANSKIVYGYDAAGNLQTVQDENHAAANTTYAYDYANRLTKVTQTLSGSPGSGGSCTAASGSIATCYFYDVQDNLNQVIDPNGNSTTYTSDDFRRMKSQVSPVSGTTTYVYDPAGNLTSTTDANSAVTNRTFDADNRIATASSNGAENLTFSYDDSTSGTFRKGRLWTMTDPSGSTVYSYERRGQIALEAKTIAGTLFSTSYTYNANGNRATIGYPSTRVVSYTYDFADRPLTVKGQVKPNPQVTYLQSAAYLPFGPESSLTLLNGTNTNVTYDLRYRPVQNTLVKGPPPALASYAYAEDGVGNITQIHDGINAAYNRDFTYDDLNRLKTANSGASLWGSGGYNYDLMGNITMATLGSITRTFTYSGTLPKLTQVNETPTPPQPGLRYVSYDNVGNETGVGATNPPPITYTYSPRNLLAASTGDSLTYTYDGRGVRTIVTRTTDGNKRYFIYTPEMSLIEETTLSTTPSASGGYDYVWVNGHPLVEENGGTHWFFTDHLGTPILQTDSSGNVFWRAEYEPYGRVYNLHGFSDQHQALHLPGQEAEMLNLSLSPIPGPGNGVTERFYNIFRWYRSSWGRYSQPDPAKSAFGLMSLRISNLADFSYTNDNPLTSYDRSGLCTRCDLCPSGRWSYNAFPAYSVAVFGGFSVSWGAFTCDGRPQTKVYVKTACVIAGPLVAAGFGGETNPFPGAACGCNAADLLSSNTNPSNSGWLFSFGALSVTLNRSGGCGSLTGTGAGGFGKSTGVGFAYTDCTIYPRPGLWN